MHTHLGTYPFGVYISIHIPIWAYTHLGNDPFGGIQINPYTHLGIYPFGHTPIWANTQLGTYPFGGIYISIRVPNWAYTHLGIYPFGSITHLGNMPIWAILDSIKAVRFCKLIIILRLPILLFYCLLLRFGLRRLLRLHTSTTTKSVSISSHIVGRDQAGD